MNKLYTLLLAISFIILNNNLQAQECGSHPTAEQLEYMNAQRDARNSYKYTASKKMRDVPVLIWIIRTDDGQGGLDSLTLVEEFEAVNEDYAAAGLKFEFCDSFRYIDKSRYVPFNQSYESEIADSFYEQGIINIYFAPGLESWGGLALCGYSKFPPSADRIFMNNSCSDNGSTLSHEIGHYFSLYHTHQGPPLTENELVDGSNCKYAGDEICDTPADPNLQGRVRSDCEYNIPALQDANGDPYDPMVENLMSYARKECRTIFTAGQIERIAFSAENDRDYLVECCPEPIAHFGFQASRFDTFATVYFLDSSEISNNISWIIEGENDTFTNSSFSRNFSFGKSYKIKMISSNDCGTDTLEKTLFVEKNGLKLVGREETEGNLKFNIYPNPFNDNITISMEGVPGSDIQIRIFDAYGKEVYYSTAPKNAQNLELNLDQNQLNSGLYILQISGADRVKSYRLMKN